MGGWGSAMAEIVRVACVQPSSMQDLEANLQAAGVLVRQACAEGAEFVALPENVALMEHRTDVLQASAVGLDVHPAAAFFQNLARETGIWLLAGSMAADAGDGRAANRSVLIDPMGAIAATYDKIHMFDVDLPTGESYRESDVFRPGDEAVIAETPWGKLGMTVCYDLRFPQLYRALAHAGARLITVPAAFTKHTGEAHWHVLLRARAIETGCFVIAPCMWGSHSGDRKTYGHSLIIDPWGAVLADAGEGTGIAMADLDLARVDLARATIPALAHDRQFAAPTIGPGAATRRATG
jgi:predicted amidohydrolase